MAGEAEEFGDGDELVATGFELGDYGLHGLDGALVRVVEEEDAAVFDTVKGHRHTILNGHIGSPVSTAEAGDEYLSVHKEHGITYLPVYYVMFLKQDNIPEEDLVIPNPPLQA